MGIAQNRARFGTKAEERHHLYEMATSGREKGRVYPEKAGPSLDAWSHPMQCAPPDRRAGCLRRSTNLTSFSSAWEQAR